MELYHGYTARTLIVEDGARDAASAWPRSGLAHDGAPKGNHLAAEEIRAPITILADGTHGVLSQRVHASASAAARTRRSTRWA